MTKRRKIILWIGLVLSLPATYYAAVSVVFYAWLSAAEPDRWPPERAGVWVAVTLAATILFLGCFIYCLVSLIKEANRQYREEQHNPPFKRDALKRAP
jgi:heme/copper-type cytochrome/quinol oxidase subunit 2